MDRPPETEIGACGSCMRALRWVRSWDTGDTFALVADETDRTVFHLHRCWPLQSPITWRAIAAVPDPGQHQINAAGRRAVEQALKSITEKE